MRKLIKKDLMSNVLRKMLVDAKNNWQKLANNDLKKAGLTWFKVRALKYNLYKKKVYSLKGKKVHFKNGVELLYSLKEIFIDDIYKIKFDTEKPYILDCGTNIGLSVLYMKELYPLAEIIAFEPDTVNYSLLERNIDGMNNVRAVKKAVWKETTVLKFDASGTLSGKIITDPSQSASTVIETEAIRLKDYLDKPIDFLKLDIEGAEYEVLKDCGNKLSMIKNLFIEYHGYFKKITELNEIFNLLRANNFYFYIKEAANLYPTPFYREKEMMGGYEIQLNIFCFKI